MKKALLVILALVLVAALSVGLTLAFLTDTAEVENTFTVGKVDITLDETDVDVYGVKDGNTRVETNDYKLIPGHTYTKDPIVTVKGGSEKVWLFVNVVNDLAAIEADTKIEDQILAENSGWTELEDGVYYRIVNASAADQPFAVFENFTLADNAVLTDDQGNSLYDDATITVTAYAIQHDGFTTAEAAWAEVSK